MCTGIFKSRNMIAFGERGMTKQKTAPSRCPLPSWNSCSTQTSMPDPPEALRRPVRAREGPKLCNFISISIHTRTAEASQFQEIYKVLVLHCRGSRKHRACYSNQLVIDEIRNNVTAFLQLQEFNFHNLTVTSSTSSARLSLNSSKTGLAWISLRRQFYILRLI